MKNTIIITLFFLLNASTAEVIEDFESLDGWVKGRNFTENFKLAPDSAVGKGAIKVEFPIFITKRMKWNHLERQDWDEKFKGLSFWVKGDGSDNWGVITIGGYSWSYLYYFPVKDTKWRKVVVPWSDLTPATHISQNFNTKGALKPSGISFIRIGDGWRITHRNQKLKPFSYCLDQLEFIEDLGEAKPFEPGTYSLRPFDEVMKKLKNGEEATIYCIGDSITAGTGLKKPDQERYAVLLQKKLREHFKNDKITVQSRGVGGAKIADSTVWLERDISGKIPDLITYMIGYNDKSRGNSPETYVKQYGEYLDRLAEKTKGKTSILLIPPIPGKGYRFDMQDDFADAVRKIAAERNLPLCDVAQAFKKLGIQGIEPYLRDFAHPNDKGNKLFADTLFEYIKSK